MRDDDETGAVSTWISTPTAKRWSAPPTRTGSSRACSRRPSAGGACLRSTPSMRRSPGCARSSACHCGRNPPAVVARRARSPRSERGPGEPGRRRADHPRHHRRMQIAGRTAARIDRGAQLRSLRRSDAQPGRAVRLCAQYFLTDRTRRRDPRRSGPDRERPRRAAGTRSASRLLQAFPIHAAHGRLYLPLDLLGRYGVDVADVHAGRASPHLRAAASSDMRGRGGARASRARPGRSRPRPPDGVGAAGIPFRCACPFAARSLARPRHRSVRSRRGRAVAPDGRCGAPRATSRAGFSLGRAHSA